MLFVQDFFKNNNYELILNQINSPQTFPKQFEDFAG